MWPEEASSTLTERAFRFASMIFQSLVKGPKIDASFSWVLFCVFFFSDLRLIVYYNQIKVPGCIHPIFELLSHFQRLDWSSVCFHVYRFESLNLSGVINMVSCLVTTRLNLNWIREFTYLDLWFNRVLCWNVGVSTKNTRKHLWVLFKLPLSCIWGYSERDL